MKKFILKLLPLLSLLFMLNVSSAQPDKAATTGPRPYKLLTSGKQISFRSQKIIKHIMVWTSAGNRVAEHKDINASNYTVDLPISPKTYFLMVTFSDGKIYTEKIGIR